MTPAELDKWHRDYMRKLAHEATLSKIRRDGAALRVLLAANRRADERLARLFVESDLREARRKGGSVPLAVVQRAHQVRLEQGGIVLPCDRPFIQRWRTDIETEARRLGVTITWEPRCAGLNAYSWERAKKIEIAPITSAGSYAVARHELGHVARPCEKTHVRSKMGTGECCVRCELSAWQWAIAGAQPTWTRAMHDRLARSLGTYRRFSAAGERTDLDALVSGIGFRKLQLAATRRTA